MTNKLPLTGYIAAKNPMAIALRLLQKECEERAVELKLPSMDKRDLDAQAVGFFQGVAFATDLFKDIDAIPSREIRDLVFDLMVTKIDDFEELHRHIIYS